jgi:hypothetical protein
MGQINEKNKGDIFVETARPFYVAGEHVNGTVYLNLREEFKSKEIFIKIKGFECAILNKDKAKT